MKSMCCLSANNKKKKNNNIRGLPIATDVPIVLLNILYVGIRHGMWFCESSVWFYVSISLKSIRERRQCGTQREQQKHYIFLHSIII